MKGLSKKAIKAIERLIKDHFDKMSMSLIGLIPKKSKDKKIVFSSSRNNLMSLFFQALNSREPNQLEEDALATALRVANGYVDALRERTTSKIINELDGYTRNQSLKNKPLSTNKIEQVIKDDMDKAKNHFKLIANSESNKCVNLGTALKISKFSAQEGIDDPTVFFVVTIDERNDPETYRLHLLQDRLTPRVYKLSELGSEYHKKGDPWPKVQGTNPNCRCRLSYLSPGWGYNKSGKVAYIGPDHDEFSYQRNKYGLPK